LDGVRLLDARRMTDMARTSDGVTWAPVEMPDQDRFTATVEGMKAFTLTGTCPRCGPHKVAHLAGTITMVKGIEQVAPPALPTLTDVYRAMGLESGVYRSILCGCGQAHLDKDGEPKTGCGASFRVKLPIPEG
jgi:hypothetical protein